MWKKGSLLLIAATLLMMVFTGCAKKQGADQPPAPANPDVILATTTSTQDSGLLDVLIPAFEKKTGYKVKTVAVGSGQALAMGEKGEADVLLAHAPDAEKKVVAAGAAINRRLVMHNDFVVVGTPDDSAKIKGKGAKDALVAIANSKSIFVSRGDNSGTHQLEKKLWTKAAIKPAAPWYQEAGAGMGQTLGIANEKKGYTITDRATYLAQKKNFSLDILVEGDPILLNIYHVMEVNPDKFPKVNKEGAKAFADFIMSPEAQEIITNFGKDKYGQPLFFADAGKSDQDFGL
ncbi:MAG TPA: tungsten ABC transporter substrate-binding protein [Firmicutes bacterium]|nr:tungsten ABC transporter substrate-binding protein [Bacillota bacterium]HWR54928.1 substrate-binding domain-containing protein [Negativicutes bacterium]